MSDTKACPFCGEEVLAVAVKCKHCGSAIGPAAAPETPKAAPRKKSSLTSLAIFVLLVGGAFAVYNWSRTGSPTGHGFTQADVTRVEQDIRQQFGKQGSRVDDVEMMIQSPTQLTGFAKVKMPLLGDITKNCSATMGTTGQYMWQCK